jgi:hypothetical protein
LAPKSRCGELDDSDDHEPGNAPGFSSRVVGEKTSFTLSFVGVHPGGGRFLLAAQAVTAVIVRSCQSLYGLNGIAVVG